MRFGLQIYPFISVQTIFLPTFSTRHSKKRRFMLFQESKKRKVKCSLYNHYIFLQEKLYLCIKTKKLTTKLRNQD